MPSLINDSTELHMCTNADVFSAVSTLLPSRLSLIIAMRYSSGVFNAKRT